jgi:hypothetical protein
MLMPMYAWHGCLPMHRQAAEIQPDDDGANQQGEADDARGDRVRERPQDVGIGLFIPPVPSGTD